MKRTLIVVLACLCVGFMLNAVIALALGAMIPVYKLRAAATILSDFERFDASFALEPGVTRSTAAATDMKGGDGWAFVVTSGSLRQEGRGAAKSSTAPEQYGEIISTRAGWPWHCLEGEVANTPNEQPTTSVRRGWISPEHASTKLQHRPADEQISVMPTTPLWSVVFWNTIVLSSPFVIVSLLVLGALGMRRRDRILTGHCADCGYPLDQLSACPECGATAPVFAPSDQTSDYDRYSVGNRQYTEPSRRKLARSRGDRLALSARACRYYSVTGGVDMNAKIYRGSIAVVGCLALGAMLLALPSCAQTGPGKTQSSLLQVGPVQLNGVLNNDTMAVGGETTGWSLDRGDLGPIDVDVSKVATQAAQLSGKRVAVAGQIIVKSWPIRGEVKTLVANSVMAQTRGEAGPMDIPPAPRPGK